jgi:peptidyl-prolyl cis-trans isomerase A (cyclophilin A)
MVPGLAAQNPPESKPKLEPAASQPATSQPANPALHPRVKLETTLGDIVLELDAEKAPVTVDNFVTYVEAGFFNGTIFHRVMPNFMIQGGGYLPDMTEKKEGLRPPIKNEWQNGLKNERGTIAMARLPGVADSATAQFFINVVDNKGLDAPRDGAGYAVFGNVVEGLDVVDKIKAVETAEHPKLKMMGKVVPVEPVVIKSAKVVGKFDREALKKAEAERQAAAEKADAERQAEQQKALEDVVKKIEQETGKKVEKTPSGLMYVVLEEGDGPSPKPTDTVEVHYTGWLTNGTKFDSSYDHKDDKGQIQPFTFSLSGGVIRGWLEGVALMKVGEKRKLIIPYQLAYGEAGRQPTIPPKATLIFDIELLGIK